MTGVFAVGATRPIGGLGVQEALGHMPFAFTTAIHVPLRVVLFAAPLLLAVAPHGDGSRSQPPSRCASWAVGYAV